MPDSVTVRVPMQFRRRGGRKLVVSPPGAAPWTPQRRTTIDEALVRALVQAFRWQRHLDEGRYATLSELAEAEKLDHSLVSRTLRLTLLAPEIVDAILEGTQPSEAQRQQLLHGFPIEWQAQVRTS